MKPQIFLAHASVLATSVVAAVVGAGTTLVGQGTPDPSTQGTVAAVFAAFVWAASLYHRWQTAPHDVGQPADMASKVRALLPLFDEVLARIAVARAAQQASVTGTSPASRPTPVEGAPAAKPPPLEYPPTERRGA